MADKFRYLAQNLNDECHISLCTWKHNFKSFSCDHFSESCAQPSLERDHRQGGSRCFLQQQPEALVTECLCYPSDAEAVAFQFVEVFEKA